MRHPDHEDIRTLCCEAGPLLPGDVRLACTRRRWHLGEHVATGRGHVVLDRWPNEWSKAYDPNLPIRWRAPWTWAVIIVTVAFVALCVATVATP